MNSKKPLLIVISKLAQIQVASASFALCCLVAALQLQAQQPANRVGGANQTVGQVAAHGTTPVAGVALQQVAPLMSPSWIPLSAKHQQYLDQVLQYWEYKSSQVKRYRCSFRRWEYDPIFGPKDTFKTFSEGVIKYSAPDKGLFRVEKLMQYQPPRQQGGQPTFAPAAEERFEHWICDGQWVYQFDQRLKKLVQTQLPPEMRGQAIGNGPLPFLFNAKADDIKRRFWVRIVTPPDTKKEYWLEAVPRTQDDAANFKMIHVIIDETDYLPKAMVVFDRNNAPGKTASRTTFEFTQREVNFSILAEQINIFHREFFEPAVPAGWAKDVRKWNQPVAPPTAARSPADGASANR